MHVEKVRYVTSARAHREQMAALARVEAKLDHQHDHLLHLERRMKRIMATLADLTQMAADNAAATQANGDVIASVQTAVQGIVDRLGVVEQELKDAIAANDPAQIQAAMDALAAERSAIDAQKTALDVVKNTAVDPNP